MKVMAPPIKVEASATVTSILDEGIVKAIIIDEPLSVNTESWLK